MDLLLLSNLIKCVSHDSNEHVKHENLGESCWKEEKDVDQTVSMMVLKTIDVVITDHILILIVDGCYDCLSNSWADYIFLIISERVEVKHDHR